MTKYSKEFKENALKLSDGIGNKKAAIQPGIPYYTLADRRNKSKHKPKGTDWEYPKNIFTAISKK